MLPFGSIVAAHRPLDTQTALGDRTHEAIFVGIAPHFAAGILLFNPITKRCFIRHSFKYLSDDEPVSTSYVVRDSTPADEEVLADSLSPTTPSLSSVPNVMGDPTYNNDDYSYVPLPIARAPSKF